MKKREIILIIIMVILLCGAGYYLFYFIPKSERITGLESSISQKTEDVGFAAQQVLLWGALSGTKEKITDEWAGLAKNVPKSFDDADILNRIQKIIIPYTEEVSIKFPESVEPLEATAIHTVEISFAVPYDTLQAILKAFAGENISNRIVNINCTRMEPNTETGTETDTETESLEALLMVYMSVDFLTQPYLP